MNALTAVGLDEAYRECWCIATQHYENFTIGSWLLPRTLRRHIAAIYAFARTADDLADEGERTPEERLAGLANWEAEFEASLTGSSHTPVFVALVDTMRRFDIPSTPFRRLLIAFRRDARFEPFSTFDDLREYCDHSANPVGHLVLYLFGYRDSERQKLADQLCTGLQLANFCQDVAIDAAKGRTYIPLAELEQFACSETDLHRGRMTKPLRALLSFQVQRARQFLHDGLRLAEKVDRRLAREVRLFAWGGLCILDRIEEVDFDVFTHRPQVSKTDKTKLILRARFPLAPRSWDPTVRPSRTGRGTERGDYAYCQEVTRRSSSNFYYAFRLLAPDKRDALFAVYAFCRFVDDIADDHKDRSADDLLTHWRQELHAAFAGTPTHPISRALADARRHFPIEQKHFVDLIRGVRMDLSKRRYATFDELYDYCYLVASTVGLLCIEIFGYTDPGARRYAIDLGIAFQLTNILRDVQEDARRGRVYLPLEDFARFECTEEELLAGRYSARVGALLAFECGRARAYYLRAQGALVPEDRATLAAAEAMRLIYERLLDRIEARHFDVFGHRVTLPRYEKLTLALAAWGKSQLALRLT